MNRAPQQNLLQKCCSSTLLPHPEDGRAKTVRELETLFKHFAQASCSEISCIRNGRPSTDSEDKHIPTTQRGTTHVSTKLLQGLGSHLHYAGLTIRCKKGADCM